MKNQAQFEFCMRAANKLDEIKRNIDSLNQELSTTVRDTVFLKNWTKARELAGKHEEAKTKRNEKIKKENKVNKKNKKAIISK